MRGFKLSLVLFIIAVGFTFQPAPAWGIHQIVEPRPVPVNPYIPKDNKPALRPSDQIVFWCWSSAGGIDGLGGIVDCESEITAFRLVPLIPYRAPSGHDVHSSPREQTAGMLRWMKNGPELGGNMQVNDDCDDSDVVNPEKWEQPISVRSEGKRMYFQYLYPEVSGITAVHFNWRGVTSTMFYYVNYASGFKLQWLSTSVIVSLKYLVPLERIGEHYEVVLGAEGEQTHPNSIYATQGTIKTLKEIAEIFHSLTTYKLSVNDLSLPWGGMFDLNEKWCARKKETGKTSIPHWTHRDGRDADINRTPIGAPAPINCDPDDALHDAVSEVRGGDVFPDIQCEASKVLKKDADGNPIWEPISRYHIDFGY